MIKIEETEEYSRCNGCFSAEGLKDLLIGQVKITVCEKCQGEIVNLLKGE